MKIGIPLFRALTIETDLNAAGIEVIGDFTYEPAYTTKKGLKIGDGYEIWLRDNTLEMHEMSKHIDPETLEISFDAGKTFKLYAPFALCMQGIEPKEIK